MSYKQVLVISDNEAIIYALIELLYAQPQLSEGRSFAFACYPKHRSLVNHQILGHTIEPLDLKTQYKDVVKEYELVISAHCKQIFPEEMVRAVKCINIHPGYNPYNRGWYPQVFSILNGLQLGATIHEIDEQLDHGLIIAREKVELYAWDTSLTAYQRVQQAEVKLLQNYLLKILEGDYETSGPEEAGNVNYKRDFEALQHIELDDKITFKQAINRFRALTHGDYKNAYFIDPATNKKVYLRIELEVEDEITE